MKALISTVFLALLCISISGQSPVSLKLNLEKGKVYKVRSNTKQTIKQTANGQQFNVDVTSGLVTSYKILSQVNDVMEMEFKFDTIATKISSAMYTKETNSAKGGNDPVDKILNKMSKYKIIAKISTGGKFLNFVNYGKYKDSVMFVMDSIPASKKDMATKQADALIKESAVQSMIEPVFAYLPEGSVKTGDSWETSYVRTASNVSLMMQNTFTLKSVENNQASVSGKTEMESLPSNDPAAQMSQDLKGNMTFDGTIDLKTGLLLKNTEKGHIEGTTTIKNNGNEMKMPMTAETLTETTMVK